MEIEIQKFKRPTKYLKLPDNIRDEIGYYGKYLVQK
jgi:hypothetical protein